MKVAIISTKAYKLFNNRAKQTFGGSEAQLFLLSQELKDKHDIHFIVGDEGQKTKEKYDQVTLHKACNLSKKHTIYKIFTTLQKINPDVIIQRGAGWETVIGALYAKLYKKKFIYSVAHMIDVDGTFAKKGLVGKLFNKALDTTHTIVYQSKDQKKALGKKGPVIPNGDLIPKRTSKGEYILWVGRSDAWKRPQIFLDVARRDPKHKYVMIMPKSTDIKTYTSVKRSAAKIKNLKVHELVPYDKIRGFYKNASVFVLTSKMEGFPNATINAAMYGVPTVSVSFDVDNLINKHLGICLKGNIDKLPAAITQVQSKKYASKAKEYAHKHHDIKQLAQRWGEIIESK